MLMALALAERLGKRGLLSFSLHPGVIFETNLSTHLDIPGGGLQGLCKLTYPVSLLGSDTHLPSSYTNWYISGS